MDIYLNYRSVVTLHDVDINKEAGRLIKKLRINHNMSEENLGAIVGLSQQQISRYENGSSQLTLRMVERLSGVFHITLWEYIDMLKASLLNYNLDD